MEQFTQITKKYFCDTICRTPSIFVGSGMANGFFLQDRSKDIITECKGIDIEKAAQRIGKMKSNAIEFADQQGEISRLGFDQVDTKDTFFSLENILICRRYYKSLDKYRYVIYMTV